MKEDPKDTDKQEGLFSAVLLHLLDELSLAEASALGREFGLLYGTLLFEPGVAGIRKAGAGVRTGAGGPL